MKSYRYPFRVMLLASSQQLPAGNEAHADILRFKKFTYVDQQGTGIEAFSFLMPSEWQFEGGMQWILEALLNIILPEFRDGFPALNVITHENVPELPKILGAGTQAGGGVISSATGAKLKVNYIMDNVSMEEEFYAVAELISFPIQSMYWIFYNTILYIDYIFSFKAEKGDLENNTKVFQTITSSFKLNPEWYAKYSHVIEYMARQRISQIKSIGEFSRMLGIDRYYDPFEEREVELPSGCNHAWSNNNGEYILSDNPNFNPNAGSNLHW